MVIEPLYNEAAIERVIDACKWLVRDFQIVKSLALPRGFLLLGCSDCDEFIWSRGRLNLLFQYVFNYFNMCLAISSGASVTGD